VYIIIGNSSKLRPSYSDNGDNDDRCMPVLSSLNCIIDLLFVQESHRRPRSPAGISKADLCLSDF